MADKLRLLIVEDSVADSAVMVDNLRRFGFDPDWRRVESENEYLDALKQEWDVILADYNIPGFGGVRALLLLREQRLDIPFILVSGAIGEETAVQALQHGAADYLLKDRLTRLAPAVRQALEKGRLRRKQAEAMQALRQSEERFRQMAENIGEVFWMTDPAKNEMLYISPGYERIWGRSCDELYRQPQIWLDAIVPDDRERVTAALPRQIAGGYDQEYRISRPDGALRWIRDRAFPVKDKEGRTFRIVGVAEDITEHKKLEEQFLQAQRMEAIGTLATGVAHDLNNILTPMLMAAGILRETIGESKDRHIVDLVEQGAQRGAGIVRQLLTFSRGIEGARASMQPRHLLKEMENLIRETFPKNIVLQRRSRLDLWTVKADSTQIHQVLMNLCVNARDAMPAGGTLLIEAQNRLLAVADASLDPQAHPGPYVMLTVSDTGHGIPPEIIKRIFDPFFTTKGVGKGTGLGLSTVVGIVKDHGGFVRVYSEPGRGAAFHIYLPAETGPVAAEVRAAAAPRTQGRGELILIADDEAPIREAAKRALEGRGYRVVTASNGEEAVTRFIENRDQVRLVVTDIMMPKMDGPSLVRSLRVLDRGLKVVATSGLEHQDRRAEFTALGVSEVLMKPYDVSQLLDAIRRQQA